jgi:excisionase family DNA binding protein
MSAPLNLVSTPLLDASDVATMLNVKRSTVFELSRRQEDPIPSVKVGRSKRFIRSHVEEWVAQKMASHP